MKSSYRRIAMQLLDKFKDYPKVEFAADVWESAVSTNVSGWGVRATWTDCSKPPCVTPSGIFFHAESEDEAQAVVEAIEVVRRGRA